MRFLFKNVLTCMILNSFSHKKIKENIRKRPTVVLPSRLVLFWAPTDFTSKYIFFTRSITFWNFILSIFVIVFFLLFIIPLGKSLSADYQLVLLSNLVLEFQATAVFVMLILCMNRKLFSFLFELNLFLLYICVCIVKI